MNYAEADKKIKKEFISNLFFILLFIAISMIVYNKWPNDWFFWIPVAMAVLNITITIVTAILIGVTKLKNKRS